MSRATKNKKLRQTLHNISTRVFSEIDNSYGFVTPCMFETEFAKKTTKDGYNFDKYNVSEDLTNLLEELGVEKKKSEQNFAKLLTYTQQAQQAIKTKNITVLEDIENETSILLASLKNMEKELYTDELTGLLNRKGLKSDIADDKGNLKQKGVLVVFDLDNFKHINDAYGHDMGDGILKVFSKNILQKTIENLPKNKTFVARIGGDEFACITDSANIVYLKNQLKKLQKNPLQIKINQEHKEGIHFSFGCSLFAQGRAYSEVFGEANKAMYADKKKRKSEEVI